MPYLTISDAKEKREEAKNKAVDLREAGDLKEASELLEEVIAWDEANPNDRGLVDALGHLRITFSRLAEEQDGSEAQKAYLQKALDAIKRALTVAKKVR